MKVKSFNQKGSALIFALIFLLILSVMGASLMFLSQSETWSGMNYKMMTQTRYGAEAGINAAANYLMYTYTPPASTTAFNTSVYPVKDLAGNNIKLSSIPGISANYPNSGIRSAFNSATNSHAAGTTLTAGPAQVDYTASAQLMAMAQVTPFGSTTPLTVQTWQITAHGDMTGVRTAESEVSAVLERQVSPTFAFAAFATGGGCGALSFTGNGTTDSYDSGSIAIAANGAATGSPTFQNFAGNVGTNGNQSDSGNNVQIYGSLSTPRVGVGSCSAGNVTALSGSSTQISGGIIELPQAINLPLPTIPPPGTTNINSTATLCSPLALVPVPPCTSAGGFYGDINLAGNDVVSFPPGTYNINSISITGNASIQIVPDPVTGLYGPVIINVTGNNNATPITLTGNGFSNPTYDSTMMQFNYAGSGTIKVAGNGASAAVVYAPGAAVSFKGNGAFYGAVIGNTVSDVGNGAIHYDRKLQRKLFTVGNYMLSSFSWSKY
jgi:hypothetical protein